MKPYNKFVYTICFLFILVGCSSTSALNDGEQLYTGLKKIEYKDYESNKQFITTQEEIEAVLAAAPNGALFGSSYHRTPLPWRLWLWNFTEGKRSGIAHWLNKTFTSAPVLMSDVNPTLRAKIAQTTLNNNGYFRGNVDFETITLKNPKEGKIAYKVSMNRLFTIDTIVYRGFPLGMDTLISKSNTSSYLKKGEGFSIAKLELERKRLGGLFRNNGYYYYSPGYSSYLADTLANSGTVSLRLQMADSIDNNISRRWYIGKTDIYLRKQLEYEVPDTFHRRSLTIHYKGKSSPIRPRVVLADLKLRNKQLFNEDAFKESLSRLTANENFSSVDFKFTPRDSSLTCDTLDMEIDCVFNKPYDISLEGRFTGKTTSRIGPGAELTLSRRNALRYGEKLSLNVFGSIEWQTGASGSSSKVGVNSYEYGINATFELPRLLLPAMSSRRWYKAPSTVIKASNQVINRGNFFNRHIMSGELTYSIQTSETRKHIISPLILEYDFMNRMTPEFEKILSENPYLKMSMMDMFIPKSRYTYIYTSPLTYKNPITWETTISESANIISVGYLLAGKSWSEKNKNIIKNPYAQFFKLETDITKKWHIKDHTDLVGHINTGIIWSYGNSSEAPYSEQFYVGGANSIRAFTVRAIGPGKYHTEQSGISYLDQTGDIKFVANLEYRPRLFGNLYGALFLDAGNVWALRENGFRGQESVFKLKSLIDEMAVGTGFGIRYDMDFFVIRIDWGVGLHMPYDTGKSGFINIKNLKDSQSLHLAIGYPF